MDCAFVASGLVVIGAYCRLLDMHVRVSPDVCLKIGVYVNIVRYIKLILLNILYSTRIYFI